MLLWDVVLDVFQGCTIISIAHRLETIPGFDRVAVLCEGKILECDDPDILLKRQDSAFKQLWTEEKNDYDIAKMKDFILLYLDLNIDSTFKRFQGNINIFSSHRSYNTSLNAY